MCTYVVQQRPVSFSPVVEWIEKRAMGPSGSLQLYMELLK